MRKPPYNTFPEIIDKNITLRQIRPSDVNDIIEISFYNAIQAISLEQAQEMQDLINRDYREGNSIHWGIAERKTDKIVGTCGYYRGLDQGAGELGCVLISQYRGQGFMTSAMLLAINFGINSIGLKRIYAITTQENIKAKQLFERLNFIKVADLEDNEIEYEYQKPL